MSSAYATDVRILTCPQCGAPVQASTAGGRVACNYCRATLDVAPRNDSTVGRVVGPAPTEAERWQGLWAQVQTPRDHARAMPPEMQQLFRAGPLSAERIPSALAIWRSYCQRASAGDAEASQHAVTLTGALSGYFVDQNDRVRQRALLESTLEALPSPPHKQVIRCQIARAAAVVGDLQAAQTWFGACDPNSADLLADTAYRFTYAVLATSRGDFRAVLSALGPARGSVPIATTYNLICDVYRANAVERLGDVHGAVAQLLAAVAASPGGAKGLQSIVSSASPPLCPQSAAQAMARMQAGG